MNDHDLDPFETRLLADLRTAVAERPTAVSASHLGRRVGALAAASALVALGITAATLLPGAPATPAYAVTPTADGTVRVTVNRLEGPDRLEADLAKAGIKAKVFYTAPGMMCSESLWGDRPAGASAAPTAPPPGLSQAQDAGLRVGTDSNSGSWIEVPKGLLRPSETLVLASSWPSKDTWAMGVGVVKGDVGQCVQVAMADLGAPVPDGQGTARAVATASPSKP